VRHAAARDQRSEVETTRRGRTCVLTRAEGEEEKQKKTHTLKHTMCGNSTGSCSCAEAREVDKGGEPNVRVWRDSEKVMLAHLHAMRDNKSKRARRRGQTPHTTEAGDAASRGVTGRSPQGTGLRTTRTDIPT